MREYFHFHPDACDQVGNMAELAVQHLLLSYKATADSTLGQRTAILVHLEQLRDDLGYDRANELEKTLIRHVVMCCMRLNDCELRYTANAGQGREIASFWEKRRPASGVTCAL